MADAKRGLKNIGLLGGAPGRRTNAPAQYRDRQKQYFADATAAFTEIYAPYATNFVKARMQGLNPENFFAWSGAELRMADTTKQGTSLSKKTDDQKEYLIRSPAIDYVAEGAKVETMGSTWLVTNPTNLAGVNATGIMRRCNAVWRFLDWYGNVRAEPILVEKAQASATANDFQEMTLIMQGYFNIICQKNPQTEQLDHNSRLILGRRAYQITGYSDITQEFTGDDESTHLLYFTARMQEPNLEIDDMEARVAGGKTFSWAVFVTGKPSMTAGDTAAFTAASQRCGETAESTEEHPISYAWESSDPAVATVDADGTVTAVAPGTCRITAVLDENRACSGSFALTVEADTEAAPAVKFLSEVPKVLRAYDMETMTAALFKGGVQQDDPITWSWGGAEDGSCSVSAERNRLTVNCWGGSATPLTITAESGGVSAQITLALEGL